MRAFTRWRYLPAVGRSREPSADIVDFTAEEHLGPNKKAGRRAGVAAYPEYRIRQGSNLDSRDFDEDRHSPQDKIILIDDVPIKYGEDAFENLSGIK